METKAKQNGIAKKQTASSQEVKKKLAEEAIGKPSATTKAREAEKTDKAPVNLDDRIQKFEKLRGLATQRERLVQTLNELTKFNYNQGDSSSFYLRDSHGMEFKTTNSNLIQLVSVHLQSTLETRKGELENEIVSFEL
ncbi:hypothetical protein ED312_06440 [Sinomicrobium pectinilyticum]|uniref:Uncharacterized protein n=1 Tax=Sinomicrobium pectinilyticum TaxID=1084421 RepID=A0A3N0ERC2_SINP1|nr:hypothetical protein [Sinomicrobium pectinilyticum]RNL90352.1 hypothetical protein ED312_06440 [Sinomicrobium pectinilyticum]